MKRFWIFAAAILISLTVSSSYCDETKRSAIVADIKGNVMVKLESSLPWTDAKVGDVLKEGSFIKTGEKSTAIIFVDAKNETAAVEMAEKSLLSFTTLVKESSTGMKKTLLDLSIGQILIKAEKLDTPDSKFEVKTPTSVVGVRGTKFSVKVEALK